MCEFFPFPPFLFARSCPPEVETSEQDVALFLLSLSLSLSLSHFSLFPPSSSTTINHLPVCFAKDSFKKRSLMSITTLHTCLCKLVTFPKQTSSPNTPVCVVRSLKSGGILQDVSCSLARVMMGGRRKRRRTEDVSGRS